MIPKQNAGFRIYVVYWSKFKNWVPTYIGLGLVLSVLGYLIFYGKRRFIIFGVDE